eukprot:TRINITY_DN6955_c0_g1_i2.p1 TRINITY_DN6955_c0_g1~~TRINITY_DN6955_c0_g1_i2.p1  ORF type:complete len:217 (-),score=47.70 TRINITY_DN6955_c0_g1_i2:55-705(-)
MPDLTLISRLSDSLILCASLEYVDKSPHHQEISQQSKDLLKKFNYNSPPSMHIDSGLWFFTYLIKGEVVFLTVSEKSYPKNFAIKFLQEISTEFDIQYGSYVAKAMRPYEFIKFETFITKTKKMYSDVRGQSNINKVTEGLSDVQKIMSRNITEILGRGEKLENVTKKSEKLMNYSSKLKNTSHELNSGYFWRTYAPLIIALVVFLVVIFARFYFW